MALSSDPPRPPDITSNIAAIESGDRPESSHRDEIETMLRDGAWARAYGEWADHTDLTEHDWAVVTDLDLTDDFDFWWNAEDEQVRYDPPVVPEDWTNRDVHPNLETHSQASAITRGLDELGQTVSDLLQQEYVDWDTVEPSDEPE
ncbi:MAG: hypothetical protein ACQEQY_07930 [Halobacteriota archaeon]